MATKAERLMDGTEFLLWCLDQDDPDIRCRLAMADIFDGVTFAEGLA